jgi:DUF1009 family protein
VLEYKRSNGVNKIGLIAGNGRFPMLFAQAAKAKGFGVICVAIEEEADKKISEYADEVFWIKLGEFSKLITIFKQEGIKKCVMAGQIKKVRIFDTSLKLDNIAKTILNSISNNRDTLILSAAIAKLKSSGIEIINSATFLGELLPERGILTKRKPTDKERADIVFGVPIARKIAGLDIGQAIAVKERVVVAVEAVEGTDETIKRAAKLAGPGLVIIKVARPFQDMRFDIPVVGINTIKALIEAGSNVLAVESKKTLLMDRDELINFADANGISVVSV